MTLVKVILLLAVAYNQVRADVIPADYVETVLAKDGVSRIVSGWEASPGQFPHHAALRMINAAGAVSGCGASVVHREWLISAAHCTAQQVTIVVRAGVVSIHNPEHISDTQEWYNYPTFNEDTPRIVQPNDIALIKLVVPFVWSPLLQPIRVQSSSDAFRDYNREVMEASGHGMLWTNGVQPEILNWVYLRAISNSICQMTYGVNLITSNSICTQGFNVTSQSVCSGDSGGPLMHTDNNGERVLVGVASFVAGGEWGCHSGLPAGFIRTGPFLSWFEQISGIDFENLDEETNTDSPTTAEASTTTSATTTTTEVPTTTAVPTTTEAPTTTKVPTTTEVPATTEVPTTTEVSTTTDVPTTTEDPATTAEAETEVTTIGPITEPTTEPDVEEETESSETEEEDSSEEDSDEELAELLKRLEVKVNVKVRINKYGKKISHKHKHKFHV